MPEATLRIRVERVEKQVEQLSKLSDAVADLSQQFSQYRDEARAEVISLREEIRAGDEETRRTLRDEIREVRTHMGVLHEDLVERLKVLGEGVPRGARTPTPPTTRGPKTGR